MRPLSLLALFGVSDCGDAPKPSSAECETVEAECPADGGRSYWSTCTDGGWQSVEQCREDGSCFVADHGAEDMGGWLDLWVECSDDYTTIKGVICCPLEP